VHTAYSFDAYAFGTRHEPAAAYRFAQGEQLMLLPNDDEGNPTQAQQLRTPLDFAAVTDHSEYLGAVNHCSEPGSEVYDTPVCVSFRDGDLNDFIAWGTPLTDEDPERIASVCGAEDSDCPAANRTVWARVVQAAEDAYDRSSECSFTSFPAYEWTGNTAGSNFHRNVIFRNGNVPDAVTSYFEAPTPLQLWEALAADCTEADGCDVMAIPHNSNLSNGRMFQPSYLGAETLSEEREIAALRARTEPVIEMFQHKGNSECINGISGVLGVEDELCDIENFRMYQPDCRDEIGSLGMINQGCVSRYDYTRNILLTGLAEQQRMGVNPYQLGMIASTDTHNAIPGASDEATYLGHQSGQEATIEGRLASTSTVLGSTNNAGGLAGVWAVENSRDAIFDALSRRETFGTSGSRIIPRFFGGTNLPDNMCDRADMVEQGYDQGVPMGGTLQAEAGSPSFVFSAMRDPDASQAPLQRLQIVKGWVEEDGSMHYDVFDVAGDADNGASVDEETCERQGEGAESLCAQWTDPSFDPEKPAYYYGRVVENPSCRWTWYQCLSIEEEDRPRFCASRDRFTQEMAWTSPIWLTPTE